jgi:CTP synthase
VFYDQGLDKEILKMFNLQYHDNGKIKEWQDFVQRFRELKKEVTIGIVGKYFDTGDFNLEDSYISVIEAIKHACFELRVKPVIKWINSKQFEKDHSKVLTLKELGGLIVPGGFGESGVEGKILAIKYARENNIPYLGLCYGMQLAVVEFARDVCGMKDAHTTEISKETKHPVIDILPEQVKHLKFSDYGATMRLGEYPAVLKKDTLIYKLYGTDKVSERHRHRYEVNPEYISKIEEKGMVFSGSSPDRRLMEFMEIPGHKYFVGTQAHPEFKSRPLRPHPLFLGLIKAASE